jgi:hypothetical protein
MAQLPFGGNRVPSLTTWAIASRSAVNFDALPLPEISFEVRVPLCLPPCQARGCRAARREHAVMPGDDAVLSSIRTGLVKPNSRMLPTRCGPNAWQLAAPGF